jgi:tetratricopeptide (TPR) repeat protein
MRQIITRALVTALLVFPACGGEPAEDPAAVELRRKNDLADAATRLRNNMLDDAERIYQRVLEAHPADPEAIAGMGKLQYQRKNVDEAERYLTKAIELDDSIAEHHAILGELYSLSKRHEQAVIAYGAAWAKDSERSEYGLPYGRELVRLERWDEAERVLREVADLDPQAITADGVGVHTVLADSLRGQKKLDDALRMYMKAQTTYGSDKMARAGAAFVYEDKNDIRHALDEWAAYIQRDCCSEYSRTVAQKKIMELKASTGDVDEDVPAEGPDQGA